MAAPGQIGQELLDLFALDLAVAVDWNDVVEAELASVPEANRGWKWMEHDGTGSSYSAMSFNVVHGSSRRICKARPPCLPCAERSCLS